MEHKVKIVDDYDSWNLWSDEEPPDHASGNIEGAWIQSNETKYGILHLSDLASIKAQNAWCTKGGSSERMSFQRFYKWRYINGTIPSQDALGESAAVWPWSKAPGELRTLLAPITIPESIILLPLSVTQIPLWVCGGWNKQTTKYLDDGRMFVAAE